MSLLWFEFLLKPDLLHTHLTKKNPEPSATDLISEFISATPETQAPPTEFSSPDVDAQNKNEGLKLGRKQLALKILSLKVAAFLKFNLDTLEKSLPLSKQVQLLSDLCTVTSGKVVNFPLSLVHECVIGPEGSKQALNFALTLYHRWLLRAQVHRGCATKAKAIPIIPGPPEAALVAYPQVREDMFISSMEAFTQTSIDFLMQIVADDEPFRVLTFDCFEALDDRSESVSQRFDRAVPISKTELKAQIHFDLCIYHLFAKNYALAKENVVLCRDSLAQLKRETAGRELFYCAVDESELEAYLMACGVFDEPPTLMQRFNESILNQYAGIVEILKEDNLAQEIPFEQRKILEMDIEGAISTGKMPEGRELHNQVIILNTIRYVVQPENILAHDLFIQHFKGSNEMLKCFFQAVIDVYSRFSLEQKGRLKSYCLEIVECLSESQIDAVLEPSKVFQAKEIEEFKRQKVKDIVEIKGLAVQTDWTFCDTKNHVLEVASLERQLNFFPKANGVRQLLVKLASTNLSKPLWTLNPSWNIPIPIKSVIMSLQRGFLQDFSYVLVGKARELAARKEFGTAIAMLTALKNETQRPELSNNQNVVKLCKLIQWEALLVQIMQCLEEWPKKPADPSVLIRNCKQCLLSLQNNEPIIPRAEILEHCSAMLLNLCEWSSVAVPEKKFASLDLAAAFASAVLDIEKFKVLKKVNKEAWDLVLPMFLSPPSSKRQSTSEPPGGTNSNMQTILAPFLQKLRDPLIVSIVLSLLAKIHNALKDEPNSDISAEYTFLWPATVSNANAYNMRAVSETIGTLLNQALRFYPNNIAWIKLKGDLEFVNGYNEAAMRHYVMAVMTSTEYCTLPVQRPQIDDHLVRRMVKCSSNMNAHMQAAVLCQFFDETDFSLAFKCISEKTSSSPEAMDLYYGCIWDTTLLEFIINQHAKRGEHKRKLQAISYMGLLELNANNNDEIKQQASSVRKARFLRALAKQYLL